MASSRSGIKSPPGYYIEKELDKGGFGTVYKALNAQTGARCALKAIDIPNLPVVYREQIKDAWRKEVDTLVKVRGHEGIVEYRGSFEFNNKLWVEMEYCAGGSLNTFFWSKKPKKTTKHRFMVELASAVAFLHDNDVVHRDLKPDNVLISYDIDGIPRIKVADFGLAKAIASSSLQGDLDQYYMHSGVGTTYYMAPEVFKKKYTLKADIHAMGLIFMSLIRETHISNRLLTFVPVHDGNIWPIGKYQNYTELNIKVNPNAKVGENIRNLLLSMLLYDYKQRPTAEVVLDLLKKETTPDDLDPLPYAREMTMNPAPGSEEALAMARAVTPVHQDDNSDEDDMTSYSFDF